MLIIFNPTAGRARRSRLAKALRVLRAGGAAVELAETLGPGHAGRIAADAAARGAALVVAAGGDGTIAEVAGGIAGSRTQLGLLPLGTANVLAHELAVPISPEAAATLLLTGRPVPIFPGLARYADGSARLFVQMLGAGFDAAVVHALRPEEKRRLGKGAYVLESARQMTRYGFPRIAVALDGEVPRDAASVIIGKGRFYAGRFRALPGASPLAPGFSVLVFRHGGVSGAILAGAALPLHLLHRVPGASLHKASAIALSGEGISAQADGDAARELPVRVEDAPHPIRVVLA